MSITYTILEFIIPIHSITCELEASEKFNAIHKPKLITHITFQLIPLNIFLSQKKKKNRGQNAYQRKN